MSKARYSLAIIVFVAIFVTGVVLACVYEETADMRCLYAALAYGGGAFFANLIWFDGVVIKVAMFGFSICGTVLGFVVGLLGSLLGWILLLILFPFIFSVVAAILIFTLMAIILIASVMFPINLFRYGRDLD